MDLLWGVATAAYQVEGGINGPGEPANNWAAWDRTGRVERCGQALRFWDEPEALLDRAHAMGCNAFRFSLEWARLQPHAAAHAGTEPDWDDAALDRYADLIVSCRERGMEPVVTLLHFTHPLWLGEDLWLREDAHLWFERYARRCVTEVGRRVASRGQEPVRWWITINEPAVVPVMTYLLGMFPGTGRGLVRTACALDRIIAAHVRGYDAVHDVYEREGWGEPLVSTNQLSSTVVDMDAVLDELLLARERGVLRRELEEHLDEARARATRRVAAAPRRGLTASALDAVARRAGVVATARGTRLAHDELYRSPRPRKLDFLSLDHYDPVAGHFFGPASAAARSYRSTPGVAELWEQEHSSASLGVFIRQAHLRAPDRPILIAENGMCTPGPDPRPDGLRRDDFLLRMCAEVVRARDEGIPIAGYIHWTIADNYEWGSYRPRFGLHGVDRAGDTPTIMDTDAMGVDSSGAFRRVVASV